MTQSAHSNPRCLLFPTCENSQSSPHIFSGNCVFFFSYYSCFSREREVWMNVNLFKFGGNFLTFYRSSSMLESFDKILQKSYWHQILVNFLSHSDNSNYVQILCAPIITRIIRTRERSFHNILKGVILIKRTICLQNYRVKWSLCNKIFQRKIITYFRARINFKFGLLYCVLAARRGERFALWNFHNLIFIKPSEITNMQSRAQIRFHYKRISTNYIATRWILQMTQWYFNSIVIR